LADLRKTKMRSFHVDIDFIGGEENVERHGSGRFICNKHYSKLMSFGGMVREKREERFLERRTIYR